MPNEPSKIVSYSDLPTPRQERIYKRLVLVDSDPADFFRAASSVCLFRYEHLDWLKTTLNAAGYIDYLFH